MSLVLPFWVVVAVPPFSKVARPGWICSGMVSMLALIVSRAVWACETTLGSGLVAAAQAHCLGALLAPVIPHLRRVMPLMAMFRRVLQPLHRAVVGGAHRRLGHA